MYIKYLKYFASLIIALNLLNSQETIGLGLYEDDLISYLRDNYKTSSTLSYNNARDKMYGLIDNQNGTVFGVYTNFSVNNVPENDPRPIVHEGGLDCEHVWPQSMYDDNDPQTSIMKTDLHHLRPCKSNVNSSRGNKPFNDNPDNQTNTWWWLDQSITYIPTNNIDEYSESESSFFEPREDKKGDIARTIFYFHTMYSEVSDYNFFSVQKNTLKIWHENDPVNQNEIDRTWNIAYYQQNKPNPFIIDETLVDRAYFYDGYILGDINGDGILNVLDLVELINVILAGISNNMDIVDMNTDGYINILDVVILANSIIS